MKESVMEKNIVAAAADNTVATVDTVIAGNGGGIGGKDKAKRAKRNIPVSKIVTYIVLILYTIILFAPFVIIIFTSFMSDAEITANTSFHLFPKKFVIEGYELIFGVGTDFEDMPNLFLGFFNTLWQTLIPLVGGLLVSALVAFVYSKFRFPGRKVLFLITVLTMTFPLGAFGFVSYLFYYNIGWVGGVKGILPIIIPGLFGSASMIFFLRTYFDSALSNEVLEAAKIDGASSMRIFFSMVLPLAKPALIAQFLLGFVGGYNSYGAALMYLYREKSLWNLQLTLAEMVSYVSQEGGGYGNAQCAVALMGMLPLIVLYVFVQKYFIEGVNIGGGKE